MLQLNTNSFVPFFVHHQETMKSCRPTKQKQQQATLKLQTKTIKCPPTNRTTRHQDHLTSQAVRLHTLKTTTTTTATTIKIS